MGSASLFAKKLLTGRGRSQRRCSSSLCSSKRILGLRALYFLVAEVIDRFHYLKVGLSVVLVFVGLKMLAADVYTVPIGASLGFIVLVLAVAMAASWYWPRTVQETDERDSLAGPDIRENKSA
jgi:hypothetical protein